MSLAPNLEAAYRYRSLGLSVLPLEAGAKTPVKGKSWKSFQERPISTADLEEYYKQNPNRNIGIIAGSVSGNLAIIDVDDPTRFRMSGAEDRLRNITRDTWTVRSGKRGIHIYLKTPVPISKGPRKEWGVDIQAEGGYVVAPKSIYRNGGQYEFLSYPERIIELPTLEEIDFLRPNIANREKEIRPYGIPWKFWEIFRFGEFEKHGYGSYGSKGGRSGFDAHFLAYLIEDGWNWKEILSLYETGAHFSNRFKAGEKSSGYDYLKIQYEKAIEYVSINRSELKNKLIEAEALLQTLELPGRTGLTDLSVLKAFLKIAYRTNKTEIQASRREIMQIAGISTPNTLQGSLSRIFESGFIQKSRAHSTHYATTYNINPILDLVPELYHTYTQQTVKEWYNYDTLGKSKVFSGNDVFRFKGVGKTGEEVFRKIKEKPGMTASEIIEVSRVARRTVYRKLEIMAKVSMVEDREGKWFPLQFDYTEVARKLGTDGTLEKQRAMHEREREAHREVLRRRKSSMLANVDMVTGEIR